VKVKRPAFAVAEDTFEGERAGMVGHGELHRVSPWRRPALHSAGQLAQLVSRPWAVVANEVSWRVVIRETRMPRARNAPCIDVCAGGRDRRGQARRIGASLAVVGSSSCHGSAGRVQAGR